MRKIVFKILCNKSDLVKDFLVILMPSPLEKIVILIVWFVVNYGCKRLRPS
jgi:hypothetical protein